MSRVVVTLAAGDQNLDGSEVADYVAPRTADVHTGPAAGGTFVDHLISRNAGDLVDTKNLGRMGSDGHDALIWVFEHLTVATWNVYVGNEPDAVRAGLTRIHRHGVDVIALQEVRPAVLAAVQDWAHERGYWLQSGVRAGDRCVLLVARKPGRQLLRRGVMTMRRRWVGPKGGDQAPRVFPIIRFRDGDLVVRATSIHGPTGGLDGKNAAAVAECCRRLNRWISRGR